MSNPQRGPRLDLQHLATFIAVVQLETFTAAAQARSIPRTTATRHVAMLEATLGTRLLERTTRRTKVTRAGGKLYERGLRILIEVRAAEELTADADGPLSGSVRVSAPFEYGLAFLAPTLSAFARAHPVVHLDVELASRRADLVSEQVDIALRIGPLASSSLVARRVGAIRLWLCAAPSLLLKHAPITRPESLRRLPTVQFKAEQRRLPWKPGSSKRAVVLDFPPGAIEANSHALLRLMAEEGLGVARLPSFIARDAIARGVLQRVLPEWSFPTVPVHAVVNGTELLPRSTRALLDLFTAHGNAFGS